MIPILLQDASFDLHQTCIPVPVCLHDRPVSLHQPAHEVPGDDHRGDGHRERRHPRPVHLHAATRRFPRGQDRKL